MNELSISRRNFFTGAATVAAGVAAASLVGCSAEGESTAIADSIPGVPDTWDYEADIVVVGYGGSGSLASLEALTQGSSVIALEKSPYNTGGNLGCSGGTIHDCPGADIDEWMKCYRHGTFQTGAPDEVIRPIFEEAIDSPTWLKEYGFDINWIDLFGDGHTYPTEMVEGHIAGQEGVVGLDLFRAIDGLAQDLGVDLHLGTPARRLIQNPENKEVLGVVAEDPSGNTINVKAKNGVILACGGYEFNNEMFYTFNLPGVNLVGEGHPYNTGDGLKIAMDAGADLWHIQEFHTGGICFLQPSIDANWAIYSISKKTKGGWCLIDCNAKRFMNESYVGAHNSNHKSAWDYSTPSSFDKSSSLSTDPSVLKYTIQTSDYVHLPMFYLFDSAIFDSGPLIKVPTPSSTPSRGYGSVWTREIDPDNPVNNFRVPASNDEAVDMGYIFKGNTLEELAAQIKGIRPCASEEDAINGIDAATLVDTVATYNSYVEAGEDPEFGRTSDSMMGKIETGPFYAIEAQWIMDFTEGGPRRGEHCQTLNPFGEIIPRLYNTGELGSFNSWAYTFGGIIQAFTTGRVAGRHASGLKPWDE